MNKALLENRMASLTERIKNLRQEVVNLNKSVNHRNSNMVAAIVNQIEQLLDFTGEGFNAAEEVNDSNAK